MLSFNLLIEFRAKLFPFRTIKDLQSFSFQLSLRVFSHNVCRLVNFFPKIISAKKTKKILFFKKRPPCLFERIKDDKTIGIFVIVFVCSEKRRFYLSTSISLSSCFWIILSLSLSDFVYGSLQQQQHRPSQSQIQDRIVFLALAAISKVAFRCNFFDQIWQITSRCRSQLRCSFFAYHS